MRTLWLVVAMNAAMFVAGSVIDWTSRSVSVQADLLDLLGDALATGTGLVLLGGSATALANIGCWQGVALAALGLYALCSCSTLMGVCR